MIRGYDLPKDNRVELLTWLQWFILALLAAIFVVVLIDNPAGSARRELYCGMISSLFVVISLGLFFNRTGRYTPAAVLTMASIAAAPWVSFLLDPNIFAGDFFPLVYVTIPVLLSSMLLPLLVTISLAVIQVILLVVIVMNSTASVYINSASFLIFVSSLSVLSIISNYLSRRSAWQIYHQKQQLDQENRALKTAEEALHQSEEFQRGIISASPLAIITTDSEGRVLSWNTAAEKIFGWTEKEALGRYPRFIPEEKLDEYNALLSRSLAGESFTQLELVRMNRDGRAVRISLSTAPLRNREGACTGILAIISDVTQQHEFRQGIDRQKQIFQNLFEGSPDAIVLLDLKDCVLQMNHTFSRLFGYSEDEAVGKYLNDLIAPDHLRDEADELTGIVTSNQVIQEETDRCRKDGSLVRVQVIGYPNILDGIQIGTFGIYRDLTEQKQLEQQLLQSQRIDSIGRLAGGIAHDFNNMLGVILGYTELAMDRLDPEEELFDDLKEVYAAAQRSAELTKQLLTFARKQTVNPKHIDVNETIKSMISMVQRLIGEDILLEFFPSDKQPVIWVDPSQIDQIVINLCINAREAIQNTGRITVRTNMLSVYEDVPDVDPGSYVTISVCDDGKGMKPEVQEKIFEPFFTTKKVGEGTGLGLSTVYGIVKQNGGFINVNSTPGQGTTMMVYLPCRQDGTVPQAEPEPMPDMQGNLEQVLVVDDDPMILGMTASMLEKLNYTVLIAEGGQEALKIIEANRDIRALITDVVMPEMNGRELYETVMLVNPSIKCLYISGYTARYIMPEEGLPGPAAFLQKPFSRTDLSRKLYELLHNNT